jgi:hypothetical protein
MGEEGKRRGEKILLNLIGYILDENIFSMLIKFCFFKLLFLI